MWMLFVTKHKNMMIYMIMPRTEVHDHVWLAFLLQKETLARGMWT